MNDPSSPLFRFQLWRAGLPPALRLILSVNLAVFLVAAVTAILAAFGLGAPASVMEWLALDPNPATLLRRPWTPLTYGFTNLLGGGGIWGIISVAFAMYWLNWLGRDYEESYGAHRLFGVYVLSALFGALVAVALAAFSVPFPMRAIYAGAWGPVTAVMVTVATLHPNRGVGLFLLGVIQMKWIAIVFVALSLFAPDATLLGAALFGFLFAKAQQADLDLAAWARPLFRERTSRSARQSSSASSSWFGAAGGTSKSAGRTVPTKSTKREKATPLGVDQILDKILEKGVESLSADERRILDEASRDA